MCDHTKDNKIHNNYIRENINVTPFENKNKNMTVIKVVQIYIKKLQEAQVKKVIA